QLTEAVRRRPYAVVLLDEIEKAHPDVFNTLLQILEDGRLTDAQGKTVDFKNTVIIMTSNLGTQNLRKPAMGFGQATGDLTYDKMKERVNEELKRNFRPEFLNRIDEVIVFHELTKDEVYAIVDFMIKRVADQLESQDVGIELTDGAKEVLSARGYDPSLGARPLRRAIQRLIEDPVSEKILWKEYEAGDTIIVDSAPGEDGEQEVVFRKAERSPDHPPVELAGVTEGDGEAIPEA
ncbi:MAG: ATP-dependent Clp protease ATP-binding subunit ClpC, partial [Actinomycetota bacterium]|nr:ATP-dependent Clp protease ATP-binding subunit ClpC [Actinomycetota bacterium]